MLFLSLFARELVYFVLFAVERSDLVGGLSGAEPPYQHWTNETLLVLLG